MAMGNTFAQRQPRRSGANRSGLAAAIFKYAVVSRSAEEAKGQLSIR
jgi:hypothetical protein